MSFELDSKLQQDSFFLADLGVCQLRLIDNAYYPWVILVPRIDGAVEITDLPIDTQRIILDEINVVAKQMQSIFTPDKTNIATLGNVVSQLHIHIIMRYKEDAAWPKPIWGEASSKYPPSIKKMMLDRLLPLTKVTL